MNKFVFSIVCSVSVTVLLASQLHAEDEVLVSVSTGTKPNDTSGQVSLELAQADQLGGRCLKVIFRDAGASFGQSRLKNGDWSGAEQFVVDVLNAARAAAKVTFTIRHKQSRNFATRVDIPLTIRPGLNHVSVGLKDLKNNDDTLPALSEIRHWYFASATKNTTLFFGDFRLVSKSSKPSPTTAKSPQGSTLASLVREGKELPEITKPVLFNTPEADRILSSLQLFPPNNPWNEDISKRPVHPNSKKKISTAEPSRHLYFNADMGFVIVPSDQPRVSVKIVSYPGESDPGPFPVPDNAPIEGWPIYGGSLAEHQRATGGDRHLIVLDPKGGRVHEFFTARRTDAGWQAGQASTFDLRTNKLRPEGWTSSDAAGLPILPAVIRYDELQRGMVEHAMRVTIRKTRRAYVYPATHFASRSDDPNLMRMGERLRLRADFDISEFSPHAQAVLKGLKKYGMIVADNGVNWCLSVAPDKRIKGLDDLTRVKGRDFEVVIPTGPNEGPRAAR